MKQSQNEITLLSHFENEVKKLQASVYESGEKQQFSAARSMACLLRLFPGKSQNSGYHNDQRTQRDA